MINEFEKEKEMKKKEQKKINKPKKGENIEEGGDENIQEVKGAKIFKQKEKVREREKKIVVKSKEESLKDLKDILKEKDIIIEILDARVPIECRSIEDEKEAINQGKQLILVLNKVDLIKR
jgi:nuclear GTP-binding protein